MHLDNRPKLKALIETAQAEGISINVQLLGPNGGVGFAQEDQGVTINNYYLRVDDPNFPEDRLIIVLFHELGHLKYFAEVPIDARNSEDSEFRAFENSLEEARRLALKQDDGGPLSLALHYIAQRQASGQEPQCYQAAIDRIISSDLWGSCKSIVEQGSEGNA